MSGAVLMVENGWMRRERWPTGEVTLADAQKAVGGYVERHVLGASAVRRRVAIVVLMNEEGRLSHIAGPPNVQMEPFGDLVGTLLVCAELELDGDWVPLTDEEAESVAVQDGVLRLR